MVIMDQAREGTKRNVVDGQFEDPDEGASKRLKVASSSCTSAVPVAACIDVPSPVDPAGNFPFSPHPMMPAMMIMLMNPVTMAHWHQQQGQIMQRLLASPPAISQRNGPNTSALLSPRVGSKAVPPFQIVKEKEWQIPYSHNYHPAKGFINGHKPIDRNQTVPQLSRTCLEPPDKLPALDLDAAKPSKFPVIQQDNAREFGISDQELAATDILCGRGGLTNSHVGNIKYRELVDQYRWHYGTCKKSLKSEIARIIVGKVREVHGRFLKKECDQWYEIGDELALQKTSQTLREGLAKIYREGLKSKMDSVNDKAQE